ncbi:MAG TPA: hypothetical protein DCM67_03315 [Propionibacteriaceae bacterium]|nr:hypothetical protein [Propionibacteriaceae bacterium]
MEPRLDVGLVGAATVWRFRHGEDLARVLAECPPGAFFVCDEEAHDLLCSNHHDVVSGWGAAAAWVDALGGSPLLTSFRRTPRHTRRGWAGSTEAGPSSLD